MYKIKYKQTVYVPKELPCAHATTMNHPVLAALYKQIQGPDRVIDGEFSLLGTPQNSADHMRELNGAVSSLLNCLW